MLDLLHTKSPFQKITAKQIAAENNILYIPNARGKRLKGKNHNKFYEKILKFPIQNQIYTYYHLVLNLNFFVWSKYFFFFS